MSEEPTARPDDEKESITCPRCASPLAARSPLSLLMKITAAAWRRLKGADGSMRFYCRACADELDPLPKEAPAARGVTTSSMTETIASGALARLCGVDPSAGERDTAVATIIAVDREGQETVVDVFDLSEDIDGRGDA